MTERTDHSSDAAGADPVRAAIQQQGAMLGHQGSRLNATFQEVEILRTQVSELLLQASELRKEVTSSRGPAVFRSSSSEPHANSPPLYDGDPNVCRALRIFAVR